MSNLPLSTFYLPFSHFFSFPFFLLSIFFSFSFIFFFSPLIRSATPQFPIVFLAPPPVHGSMRLLLASPAPPPAGRRRELPLAVHMRIRRSPPPPRPSAPPAPPTSDRRREISTPQASAGPNARQRRASRAARPFAPFADAKFAAVAEADMLRAAAHLLHPPAQSLRPPQMRRFAGARPLPHACVKERSSATTKCCVRGQKGRRHGEAPRSRTKPRFWDFSSPV